MEIKTIATNRGAYHDYFVGEKVEAGIVLTGSEIKSIRSGRVSLSDAYVRAEGGELWLVGAHVARYDAASQFGHEPARARKLLLHRQQIRDLTARVSERGFTLVPLRLYIKGGVAKLEVGLGRGKKLYDKRETIARREVEREIGRALRSRR